MRRIKYLILLTILFIPFTVKAATGSLQVTCSPTTVSPGGTVSCTIKGTTDDSVGSLKFDVSVSNGLSIVSFTKSSEWNGGLEGSRVSVYNSDQVSNTFNIGTLSVKVADGASVGSANITFSQAMFSNDVNNTTTNVDNKEVALTISTESSKSGLKSLAPTVGTFGRQFSSEDTGYLLTIPGSATTFGFTAVAENPSDTITYTNADTNATLDGSNITFSTTGGKEAMLIHIDVGSGDNKVTYSIVVQKEVSGDTNGYELSSLKIGDQTVSLISGQYEYSVTLNDVSSYEVTADLKDRENYTISNLVSPRTGEGSFTLIVTPKDSGSGLSSKTYTITVKKNANAPSSNPSSSSPSSVTPVTPPANDNPQTGGTLSVIVALLLVASFGASVYFYKKNMGYFNA